MPTWDVAFCDEMAVHSAGALHALCGCLPLVLFETWRTKVVPVASACFVWTHFVAECVLFVDPSVVVVVDVDVDVCH